MADAGDLKSLDRMVVWVRIPPPAPPLESIIYTHYNFLFRMSNLRKWDTGGTIEE